MKTVNTITLRVVTGAPIPRTLSLASIAYMAATNAWPVLGFEIKSRPATREEHAQAAADQVPIDPACDEIGAGLEEAAL